MKRTMFVILLLIATHTCFSQFGPRQMINENTSTVRMIRTADFDNDGDLDVVASAFDLITWYENLNGLGDFSEPLIIQENKSQSRSLFPADIDNDGYIDIVVSFFEDDEVVWYRNLGNGVFSSLQLIESDLQYAGGLSVADLDGDTDLDIVLGVTNGNGLYWVENLDGLGSFSPRITIDANIAQARAQAVADIDGDGGNDILTNSIGSAFLSWFENVDDLGSFTIQHNIDTVGLYENSICLVDIDDDNDLDILSTKSDEVIWRENIDGLDQFGAYIIISNQVETVFDTAAADIDVDGKIDVLSASALDDKIAWYKNESGLGNFGPQIIIDGSFPNVQTIHTADLDGDGDEDLLSASLNDQELFWYKNLTILGAQHNELENRISIYPNPVQNKLYLETELNIKSIRVYDLLGRLLQETSEQVNELNLSGVANGVLLLKIETEDGVVSKKLIKE